MTNKDVAGEHDDMITEIIDRCGVMVQWVGAGVDTAAFAYTVGLAKLDHPELIIFGLSPQTSQGVLNSIDDRSAILCGHPWTGVGPIPQSARRPGRPCYARDPPPNSGVHNHA